MDPVAMLGRPMTPISPVSSCSMPDMGSAQISLAQSAMETALHVMRTERDALSALGDLYDSDNAARDGFTNAVTAIAASVNCGGKLVISGVGKSGIIGRKSVATMNSFGIRSVFLHPTEALHGDLGLLHEHDVLLLISFSGRTLELLSLLRHVPDKIPLIALTSHLTPSTCPLFDLRPLNTSVLLPSPIPTAERISFGVEAPTTSTTVALALSDALALAVARRLHANPSVVFSSHHPGGAIGFAHKAEHSPSSTSSVVSTDRLEK